MTSEEPTFTVSVEGAFDDDGAWIIDAKASFRDDLDGIARRALLGDVRVALLEGIAREGKRGRIMGATRAMVLYDDGSGVRAIDADGAVDLQ